MASNPIPEALPAMFALAEDMADGQTAFEGDVGIKQNTETVMRAAIADARNAETAYAAAKGAKEALSTTLRIADSNGRAYLKAARAVLAQSLGESWSQAWEPTGFPNNSTAVPGSQDERLTLLASLKDYFTANPAKENAPLNVTAAEADARFTALSNARQGVNNGNTDAGQKRDARDAAVFALKTRMRGLIAELGQLLDDNDPRWEAFGLNEPGAGETPDVPEALVVTPGTAGVLHVDWADTRLAAHYRVWKQVVTMDAAFEAALTVTDSDGTLTDLPSGKTVKVRVTAVNGTYESLPSAEVEAVVV